MSNSALDLNLVSTFAKVVEQGSFTAAARSLALPKSSVSRAVSRLEDSLGVRLLQRTTRQLGLTPAGERYLAEVRGPLARLAEAASEVADLTAEPKGLVRFTLAPDMVEFGVPHILTRFTAEHPRIQIDLVVTNRQVNLVEEGVDLALRAGRLEDSTLVARRVAASDLGLYAAPAYLEKHTPPRRVSDLADHECIVYRAPGSTPIWRLTGPRGSEQVKVSGAITVDELGALRSLAAAGLGIALLPDAAAHRDLVKGTLVRVLPEHAQRGAAIFIVSPPLQHVPARVSLLRDYLAREIVAQVAGTPCDLSHRA
jgi:DNA-binding transcriptional LysR family regulator